MFFLKVSTYCFSVSFSARSRSEWPPKTALFFNSPTRWQKKRAVKRLLCQVTEFIRSCHHGLTHTLQIVVHLLLIANLSRGVEFSGNLRQGGQMVDEAAHLVIAEMGIQEIRLESLAISGPLGK